jgi:hypothetical protein
VLLPLHSLSTRCVSSSSGAQAADLIDALCNPGRLFTRSVKTMALNTTLALALAHCVLAAQTHRDSLRLLLLLLLRLLLLVVLLLLAASAEQPIRSLLELR